MIRRVLILFAILTAFTISPARGQYYGTELPFVLGANARASALGGAGTSLVGDASVLYYNPAALSNQEWKQFTFYRTTLFDADATYHAASYAHPLLGYGTIGVSLLRLDVGSIEQRDASNRLVTDDLKNSQTRLLLGYGQQITSSIAAGFDVKVDNQSFGEFSGTGVGLDVGITATQRIGHSFIHGLRQGFVLRNIIEPSVKLDQEGVADPLEAALGLSVLSRVRAADLVTTIDLVNPRFSPFRVQVGQEVRYQERFALRIGVNDGEPTYGLGGEFRGVALDYAYLSGDIGNNHRISMSFRFGSSRSQREADARANLEQEVNDQINQRMVDLERLQITTAIARGDSFFVHGRFDEAERQFESALLWDPDNAHAAEYIMRSKYETALRDARAAYERADYVQATFFAKQVLELEPDDKVATGIIRDSSDRIAESQRFGELISDLLKASIDFYSEREYTKALVGFGQVLEHDPGNTMAAEYERKSRSQIQRSVQALVRDADAAVRVSDFEGALILLERAHKLSPDNDVVRRRTSEVVEMMEAAKQATSEAAPAPVVAVPTTPGLSTPKLEATYRDAMQQFESGNIVEAVRLFEQVWAVNPQFHDVSGLLTKAYLLHGMRLYSRDQYGEAVVVWKKVLTIDPNNSKARRYLRRTDEELKKFNQVSDAQR